MSINSTLSSVDSAFVSFSKDDIGGKKERINYTGEWDGFIVHLVLDKFVR